jgi:cell division protein FtsB
MRSSRRPLLRRLSRPFVMLVQLRLLRTFLLIGVCLTVWVALNYENLRALAFAEQERDETQVSVDTLRRNLSVMRVQEEALNTNLRAIERAAREQFKLTMPGEVLVLIEREQPAGSEFGADSGEMPLDDLTNLPPML